MKLLSSAVFHVCTIKTSPRERIEFQLVRSAGRKFLALFTGNYYCHTSKEWTAYCCFGINFIPRKFGILAEVSYTAADPMI